MNQLRNLLPLGLLLAGCASSDPAAPRLPPPAPGVDCRIGISGDAAGPVNRTVLGNNIIAYQPTWNPDPRYGRNGAGIWDPAARAPVPAMLESLRRCGAPTLRWPGGCGAHVFDWHKAVGPLAERPGQDFGLPEFLRCCAELHAEPVITMADYWGEAPDFADLVEYLNSPVGTNPNGGTAWAEVRAADGHPEPYGVRWFECGNETAHGPHVNGTNGDHSRALTPQAYAERYLAVRRAMRAVDPKVLVGAVLEDAGGSATDPNEILGPWNAGVLRLAGGEADFLIHHAYLPRFSDNEAKLDVPALFRGFVATGPQLDAFYGALNRTVREQTGREIPLAITEYNASFVQDRPQPLRLSFGSALLVADLIGVLLKPEHRIANAQYWQSSNEYWGMISGYQAPYRLRPAAHVLALYQQHLGDTLLGSTVAAPTVDTFGWRGQIPPAHGAPSGQTPLGPARPVAPDWRFADGQGASATVSAVGVLDVAITTSKPINYYHASIHLPAKPLTTYHLRGEIRCDHRLLGPRGAAVQAGDGRGWDATRSAVPSSEVRDVEWTPVEVSYTTLPDATSLVIMARRMDSPEAMGFSIRNLTIQEFTPFNLGATPLVAATCSRDSASGDVVAVLINRGLDRTLRTAIALPSPAIRAVATTLAGRPEMSNEVSELIRPAPLAITLADGTAVLDLPPCSVTGVRFTAK